MKESIYHLVYDEIKNSSDKLRDIALVFSSYRASFFLDKLLARDLGVVFAPSVFSIRDFWKYLLLKYRPFYYASFLDVIVYLKSVWQGYILDFSDWDKFYPWAYPLFSTMEQIVLGCVGKERLEDAVGFVRSEAREDNFFYIWENMWDAVGKFYSLLEKDSMFTSALLLKKLYEVSDRLDSGFRRVIIAGLFMETEIEKRILQRFKEKEDWKLISIAVDLPNLIEAFDKSFEKIGVDRKLAVGVDTDKIEFVPCISELEQIRKVSSFLREEKNIPPNKIAVILPNEGMLLPFLSELEDVDVDINVSISYPPKSTMAWSFLMILERLLETMSEDGLFYEGLVDLLNHPYIERQLKDKISVLKWILERVEQEGAVFIDIFQMEDIFSEEKVLKKISWFVSNCQDISSFGEISLLLSEMFWWIIERNINLMDDLERQVAYVFYVTLMKSADSPMADERMSLKTIFRHIRTILSDEFIGFEGSPLSGIQVMGPVQSRALSFENVFYLGLNEGICPKHTNADPILTDPIRRILKLPLLRDRDILFAYDFYSCIALADKVKLFFVDSADGRYPLSRFLYQLDFLAKQGGKSIKQEKSSFLETIEVLNVERSFEKLGSDIKRLRRFSPTMIDTYILCPVRFYYKYVLQVPSQLEEDEDVNARDVGNVVHGVLEIIYRDVVSEPLSLEFFEDAKKRIPSLVGQIIDKFWTGWKIKSVRGEAIRCVIENRLIEFMENEARRWQKDPFIVKYVETRDKDTFSMNIDTQFGRIEIFGRADRIDLTQGDKFIVWDYKTGRLKYPERKALLQGASLSFDLDVLCKEVYKSFQLPMYMLLLSDNWNLPAERIDAGLISLKEMKQVRITEGLSEDDCVRLFDIIRKDVVRIIEDMLNLDKRFVPAEGNCSFCPYKRGCFVRES